MRCERRGVGEVVSSLSMLAVTMALLGGFSVLSIQSIASATKIISNGSSEAAKNAGVLLRIVATQQNSSGSYIWVFNYGWESTRLKSVYLDSAIQQGWSTTCAPLNETAMCFLRLPPGASGDVTLFFGGKSIAVSL